MPRKQIVHSEQLDHSPSQILGYNSKRIKAVIYGDGWTNSGVMQVGSSGQQAKTAAPFYTYYRPFIWEGLEPLWAMCPTNVTPPQGITIVELIEE